MVMIINANEKNQESEVKIEKTKKVKCQRCWNYFDNNEIVDDLCPRCQKMMEKF